MKILFLAPQPFFQERGTPIAVRLALKVLSHTNSYKIDLLTFHEGQDLQIDNVDISRISVPSFLNGVGPGFSAKKVACDVVFFFYALAKVLKAGRKREQYKLIHAVEESVFIALVFRFMFGIPYIYDMDSSLALQLTEKLPWLKPFSYIFEKMESWALRHSVAVIPVCDALAAIAQNRAAEHIELLPDISLGSESKQQNEIEINLRKELSLADDSRIILYVGNLEAYQGVSLLIESFARIAAKSAEWKLVIIGGRPKHIEEFRQKAADLNLSGQIILAGPRSVSLLDSYLKQADILASPRVLGNNTPMKIYSYMHSGVPVIATRLPTHTQVLSDQMAYLVDARQEEFANGLSALMADENMRIHLAANAFQEVEQKYTFEVFDRNLKGIYQRIAERLAI